MFICPCRYKGPPDVWLDKLFRVTELSCRYNIWTCPDIIWRVFIKWNIKQAFKPNPYTFLYFTPPVSVPVCRRLHSPLCCSPVPESWPSLPAHSAFRWVSGFPLSAPCSASPYSGCTPECRPLRLPILASKTHSALSSLQNYKVNIRKCWNNVFIISQWSS